MAEWAFIFDPTTRTVVILGRLPESELRVPKAAFNAARFERWKNLLDHRLTSVVLDVMNT